MHSIPNYNYTTISNETDDDDIGFDQLMLDYWFPGYSDAFISDSTKDLYYYDD